MSNVNVKPIDVEIGSLPYLGALTLTEVTAQMKEGQWGEYQSGYILTFALENGSLVRAIARKGDDWFDQLNAIRVLRPQINTFSFTKDKNKGIIVSGGLS